LINNINISVSGSLRNYITLFSRDRVWTESGFTYMSPGEIKVFYATLDSVPTDMYGMHQIKFSINYDTGSSSHLTWVAVLPVNLMKQGRDPPSKGNVGISRIVKKMSYGNTTLPVEVILQVW
jgi:hypothetical protein